MKQKLSLALALALTLSLAACGNQTGSDGSTPSAVNPPDTPTVSSAVTPESSENVEPSDTAPAPVDGEENGILIAYFGVPETDGTDTVANASRVATENGVVGNCQFIAQAIQQAVGGDLFAIETVQEYPYFIVTAAEDRPALERTMDGLKGLTDCVPGARVRGRIYGANAWQRGVIDGNPALEEAYEMGRKA